jgi:hypothetical protein
MGRILSVVVSLVVLAASLALLTGGGRKDSLIADAPVRVQNFA